MLEECLADDVTEIKLLQEHLHDVDRPADLRPHGAPADDPARRHRGMSAAVRRRQPGWADVLEEHAASERPARASSRSSAPARRRRSRSAGCSSAGRAATPCRRRPGGREAALRHAADRAETALTGLEEPLGRYLLELEGDRAEGRAWYGGPGAGELIEWEPVLTRAGVHASPTRVTQAYLELAVLVRALEGPDDGVPLRVRDREVVALGRALRPARQPPRPRARRPARARRLARSRARVRCASRRVARVRVPRGSISRTCVSSSAFGQCSTPRGTTKSSPGSSTTSRSRSWIVSRPARTRKKSSVSSCLCQTNSPCDASRRRACSR